MTASVTPYRNLSAWTRKGEGLATAAARLPWQIGEWYARGVDQFGAAVVIRAIAENRAADDTSGQPPYPHLAQVSLKTCQNYASVWRASQLNSRYREYPFWFVDAVLGIPDEPTRFRLMDEGVAEGMSVGKFRAHRDEALGKFAPPPPDSVARLNGKVTELTQANHELNDAVRDYAAQAIEFAAMQRAADARLADDPGVAMTYPRGEDHAEWVTGRCQCGGRWVCRECGAVVG